MQEEIVKELVSKYQKICFLMPTYKIINAHTFMKFNSLTLRLIKLGFKPSFLFLDQTNVVIARNYLAEAFQDFNVDQKFDLAFWMDSDHIFEENDIIDLLYHYSKYEDVEILSALYVTRDNNNPRYCAFMQKKDGKYQSIHPETKGIVEVDAIGFGCVVMSPNVMNKMYENYGKAQFQFVVKDYEGEVGHLSEDMFWCEKARELGFKIFLDAHIKIGHYGANIDEGYMRYKYEENKK